MNDTEIKEANHKIEKHNRFCFIKKTIPLYKEPVPISQIITYCILSAIFLALPSFITTTSASIFGESKVNLNNNLQQEK